MDIGAKRKPVVIFRELERRDHSITKCSTNSGTDICSNRVASPNSCIILPTAVWIKPRGDVFLKLFDEHRNAFGSTSTMADRIFDFNFPGRCSISEENLNRICDRAFVRFEILTGIAGIFADRHFFPQCINSRVFRNRIFVMISGQCSEEQADSRQYIGCNDRDRLDCRAGLSYR